MNDDPGAFCLHDEVRIDGARTGALAGLSFAAKDMFEVAGKRCCSGHPRWLTTHPPASRTAVAIETLLAAGASLAGKTQMGALAYDSRGENPHYGTPRNPRVPDAVPGGSSSGSVVAVAANLVDFAIGTDSACSVRLPASYCGIAGMRPSHGRISVEGLLPLSPSLDTVGWFARDSATLAAVGHVLLGSGPAPKRTRLLIASDAFELAGAHVRAAMESALSSARELFPENGAVTLGADSAVPPLAWWWFHLSRVQAFEAKGILNDWLRANEPAYGQGSFAGIHQADAALAAESAVIRAAVREHLATLLDQAS